MNKNVVRGTITKYRGPISDWLSCISCHHQQQQMMWGAKDHYKTTEFVSGLLGKKDKNEATTPTLAIRKLTKANS